MTDNPIRSTDTLCHVPIVAARGPGRVRPVSQRQFRDGAGAECTGEQLAVVLQGAPGTATTNTAVIPRRSPPRATGCARPLNCSAASALLVDALHFP
jgi:hypothetical protein